VTGGVCFLSLLGEALELKQDEMDQWLTQLETLVDSLALIDQQQLPPSFAKDVVTPLTSSPDAFESLRISRQVQKICDRTWAIRDEAKHRQWFFWEHFATLMNDALKADRCAAFLANHRQALHKIHPLESEEETKEETWPESEENPIFTKEGDLQICYLRFAQAGEADLVIKAERDKPGGFAEKVAIEMVSRARQFYAAARPFFPNLRPPRLVELLADAPKEATESGILGRDPGFLNAVKLVEQAASSDAAVYLQGESGTGKELFARHLHQLSERHKGPFIPINCSAIPSELIESEMFGHEKGAFTGAYFRKIGKAEQAHGGTLFLDEIGEMPLAFQAKLLRFLQEKKFTRVGGNQPVSADTRIVTATHRDLKEMVKHGEFREDLYFRINVIPIGIPPLRERGRDIRHLSEFFFEKYISKSRASRRQVDESVFEVLESYTFPGNVRELDNIIHRTVVMNQKPVLTAEDLPEDVFQHHQNADGDQFRLHPFERLDRFVPQDREVLRQLKKEVETVSMSYQRDLDRRFLLHLLRENNGSARQAAESANINRTLFYKLLKRAGIDISLLNRMD
jgi:DNA-binding NtrC family response regulator